TPLEDEEPEPPEQRWGVLYGHVMTPERKPVAGAHLLIHRMMRTPEPVILEDGTVVEPEVSPDDSTARPGIPEDPERPPEDPDGPDSRPERPPEPLTIMTDREGMFKVRLPFGAYVIEARARGFHPAEQMVRITPDRPEMRVLIVMEPFEKEPERPGGRMKIAFNMIDENSDGNPEKVFFGADLNGDGIHEIEYHMVDRNSDGDPESVEWVLDIPMEMWERIMGMVMMFIKNHHGEWGEMPPLPDDVEYWEDEGWEDGDIPFDPALLEELLGKEVEDDAPEGGSEEPEDIDNGDIDPSLVSDKESSSGAGGSPVLEIMVAIGILLLVLAAIAGFGLFIRKNRN
ncbi:MAG: hypothetical protein ACMUHY_02610, partial [Thermoplasmatota archaeon]